MVIKFSGEFSELSVYFNAALSQFGIVKIHSLFGVNFFSLNNACVKQMTFRMSVHKSLCWRHNCLVYT